MNRILTKLIMIGVCTATLTGCAPAPQVVLSQAQIDAEVQQITKKQNEQLQLLQASLTDAIHKNRALEEQAEVQQHTIKILQKLLDRDKYSGWDMPLPQQKSPVFITVAFLPMDPNSLENLIKLATDVNQ